MGLIMLILIGCAPTAYALNRAISPHDLDDFRTTAIAASAVIDNKALGHQILGDPRPIVTRYVSERKIDESTFPALSSLNKEIVKTLETYGSPAKFPAAAVGNARNDMYLASEAMRFIFAADKKEEKIFTPEDLKAMQAYKTSLDNATKFIPFWVKVVVALALGLGTMVGWKRIVVTVGEKIGKTHLTYAQGASAELVAAATIFAADHYGLPVSTTHILSSGVAGSMAANNSGLQMSTVRNMLMAWVLTLPCAILISGTLFVLLRMVF
jgi:PiT family inorganic phosphate transporter